VNVDQMMQGKMAKVEIELIQGGMHIDERGTVTFINDFDFKGVSRFYTIRAHRTGELRGWVGHQVEQKWFTALCGSILVAVVEIDDWHAPSAHPQVRRFTLTAERPAVLRVSPGHACAAMMLTDDALLGIFSSGRIETASKDDWRFDVGMWQVVA
jgi:dTDP-4-dehydrorhamnose 3,5-epimerase-like enzyme